MMFFAALFGGLALVAAAEQPPANGEATNEVSAPIVVSGSEQSEVDLALPDGGLRPVPGVHNIQVLRATRARPDLADGDGWTYAHHMDLAAWKGRLYVAWGMCPVHEDVRPYKVVYSTSSDGLNWTAPERLFPEGEALRFYFYLAKNGRMLAFSRYPAPPELPTVVQVREIRPDHTLGDVYSFIGKFGNPGYDESSDADFVAACDEALANRLLLEQSDYGNLLGDRRMSLHETTPKLLGFYPFGKAFCFYHRADGALVGVCKMGSVIVSNDEGATWSEPVLPPTLVAGAAKAWGQRTSDGRFALVYNPSREKRYPLVTVHGDDGIAFRDMRVVHGESPRLRYAGDHKDIGAQYVRGLAEWSNDGTFADAKNALWLVYSVHKEDIWVARVPLPVKADETSFPSDDFAGAVPGGAVPGGPVSNGAVSNGLVPGWNVYSPRWAPAGIVKDGETGQPCLELRDGDPYDYARAVRLFPPTQRVTVELRLKASQTTHRLEIDLCDAKGQRPVALALTEQGSVEAMDGSTPVTIGAYSAGTWLTLRLEVDLAAGQYSVSCNDSVTPVRAAFTCQPGAALERLSLRTGPWRGLGDGDTIDPATDVPASEPAVFRIENVQIQAPAGSP